MERGREFDDKKHLPFARQFKYHVYNYTYTKLLALKFMPTGEMIYSYLKNYYYLNLKKKKSALRDVAEILLIQTLPNSR